MDSKLSATSPTGSGTVGCKMTYLIPQTQSATANSTNHLSFKSRARDQILLLRRQLQDERKTHEQMVREMRDQRERDLVSLKSRVEQSESEWSKLQQRMSELWLEVEGLKSPARTHASTSSRSTQTADAPPRQPGPWSIGTEDMSELNTWRFAFGYSLAVTPIEKALHARQQASELERWLTAFKSFDGTPVQIAVASKLAAGEVKDWRTAFDFLSGTPKEIAGAIREIDKELREWWSAFDQFPGTISQKALACKEAIDEVEQWRTSFNHVCGTPAQRAEASKDFQRRFSVEQCKNFTLKRTEEALRKEWLSLKEKIKAYEDEDGSPRQNSEVRQLQERNMQLSTLLTRGVSTRETLLNAVSDYQRASLSLREAEQLLIPAGGSLSRSDLERINYPSLVDQTLPAKRKRELFEPDSLQDEAIRPAQRCRIDRSDSGGLQPEGRQESANETTHSEPKAPKELLENWRASGSSALKSRKSTKSAKASSATPASNLFLEQRSPTVPLSSGDSWRPNRVLEVTSRNVEDAETVCLKRTAEPSITVRMPGMTPPVEKKWKHSMLRKE